MKSDGTEKIMLLDLHVEGINVVENWVYFAPFPFQDVPYGICKMRTDGTDLIQLNEDDAHNIIVQGEWIYYFNFAERNSIYKIKADDS